MSCLFCLFPFCLFVNEILAQCGCVLHDIAVLDITYNSHLPIRNEIGREWFRYYSGSTTQTN